MADYKLDCPRCGAVPETAALQVIGGEFETSGVYLEPDGFAFSDAKQVNTTEERVRCSVCEAVFDLSECV